MDITQDTESYVEPVVNMEVKKHGFGFRLFIVFLVFLGILTILGLIVGFRVKRVYSEALKLVPIAEKAKGNLESQDLPALKTTLPEIKNQIQVVQSAYRPLKFLGVIPVGGKYVTDGDHLLAAANSGLEAIEILVDAVEPYVDVLGFHGSGSFSSGTAEDRTIAILGTIDKVAPKFDQVAEKLARVDQELSQINENRYNYEFRGKNIAEEAKQVKEAVHAAAVGLGDARPALEILPKIAGMESEKKYMILFHNDGELRGTGGFMTAYGILRVDKGRVNAEKSSDIYDLDNKFRERLKPPAPIEKFLKVKYWHLRDMNLSPDFKQNMDLFSSYYLKIPGEPKIDGIIGVDTNFLVDLLQILGPIDVPGFGRFSTENDPRCDCPQVVYQLELIADKPLGALVENRKGALGPLMRELITKSYAAPKPWWDDLLKAFVNNATQKHIVFYFKDQDFQNVAEKLNVAGQVNQNNGDYLLVTDVNLGGAKANFFVKEEVTQNLEIGKDGTITKKLTVVYTNSAPPSNCNLEAGKLCLNAPMPNFVRIYVPQGSQLVEALGLDDEPTVREEFGRTVFEGFIKINPQSSAKTVYTYSLPWKVGQAPKSFIIQKQVGKDQPHYKIELSDRIEEFDLTGDKKFSLNW